MSENIHQKFKVEIFELQEEIKQRIRLDLCYTASERLRHHASAIWAHMEPILKLIKT